MRNIPRNYIEPKERMKAISLCLSTKEKGVDVIIRAMEEKTYSLC